MRTEEQAALEGMTEAIIIPWRACTQGRDGVDDNGKAGVLTSLADI